MTDKESEKTPVCLPSFEDVQRSMGFDAANEIFNLWLEVHYLQNLIAEMIKKHEITSEKYSEMISKAQEMTKKRFPMAKLSFEKREKS